MSALVVLLGAVALIGVVLSWAGRFGGGSRGTGTSLRRGPSSHTTSRGRAKVGYAKRADADQQARRLMERDGVAKNVYRCSTCDKWHVGHGR